MTTFRYASFLLAGLTAVACSQSKPSMDGPVASSKRGQVTSAASTSRLRVHHKSTAHGYGVQSPAHRVKFDPTAKIAVTDKRRGSGVRIQPGHTVEMVYSASVKGGAHFAVDRKLSFVMGQGTFLPGLMKGLTGMQAGSVRRIVVPPNLGYGRRGLRSMIPGGATLIFDVEVLSVEWIRTKDAHASR